VKKPKKTTKPRCWCALCERALFASWRARIEAGLKGSADDEDSERMALIQEIHRDRSWRYPLGIAQRTSHVIDALHLDEDEDAITDLADLEQDESESVRLNGAESLGCCAASIEQFNAGGAP
jgi:hypothetical protein